MVDIIGNQRKSVVSEQFAEAISISILRLDRYVAVCIACYRKMFIYIRIIKIIIMYICSV